MDAHLALEQIKANLLRLEPSGSGGFEGLAATALADLTGLTVRLAKSGLQFGRDASSTPSSDFAVALEAKLYREQLRLEDLAGKTVLTEAALAGLAIDEIRVGEYDGAELAALLATRGRSPSLLPKRSKRSSGTRGFAPWPWTCSTAWSSPKAN